MVAFILQQQPKKDCHHSAMNAGFVFATQAVLSAFEGAIWPIIPGDQTATIPASYLDGRSMKPELSQGRLYGPMPQAVLVEVQNDRSSLSSLTTDSVERTSQIRRPHNKCRASRGGLPS